VTVLRQSMPAEGRLSRGPAALGMQRGYRLPIWRSMRSTDMPPRFWMDAAAGIVGASVLTVLFYAYQGWGFGEFDVESRRESSGETKPTRPSLSSRARETAARERTQVAMI